MPSLLLSLSSLLYQFGVGHTLLSNIVVVLGFMSLRYDIYKHAAWVLRSEVQGLGFGVGGLRFRV